MPSLTRLATKCSKCPYVDTCNHKRMQAEACMMPLTADNMQSATMPASVPHNYRDVKIGKDTTITIDLEEMKKQLVEDFYRQSGLMFGA